MKAFWSVVTCEYLAPYNITELLPCLCGHREWVWLGCGYWTCMVLSGLVWGEWMVTDREGAGLSGGPGFAFQDVEVQAKSERSESCFISGCAAQKELDVARPCSHCKFPSELKVKDSFPRFCPTRTVHDDPSPGKHQCFADTYIYICK